MSRFVIRLLAVVGTLFLQGCSDSDPTPSSLTTGETHSDKTESTENTEKTLRLATTTSTQDSGLLDVLLPMFREQTGIEVHVIAVGSGQALELGRRGDADILLTHSPAAELQFVSEGFAQERIPVFHNDFVLAGPAGHRFKVEPQVNKTEPQVDLETALRTIATENLVFVSRSDDSGTHRKELELWKAVSIEPTFSHYLKAGSGMAQTLRIAAEKQGFSLADRATFLATQMELNLEIVSQGDSRLINPYSILAIDPGRHPHINSEAANRLIAFLREPATRKVIGEFGRSKYGQPLFFVD